MKQLLVDADEFIYRACQSNEREMVVGDHHVLHTDFGSVRISLDLMFHDLMEETKMNLTMGLSCGHNFRKTLDPTYKANRKKTRKPMAFFRAIEWVKETYHFIELEGLEADDVLGLESQNFEAICSSDKDLRTIPGRLYNPMKKTWEDVTPIEADRWFYSQVLMGDTADGYKGCPGIGAVKAERLLAPCNSRPAMEAVVREAYAKAGLDDDAALLQARLARILRPGEYWKQKGPLLFSWMEVPSSDIEDKL